jgi:hypothetical protein
METIKELYELQTTISDIAIELYGEMYVTNDKFWGSPTETQLKEVTEKLLDAGYMWEPDESDKKLANDISDAMGLFNHFEDEEDEESW